MSAGVLIGVHDDMMTCTSFCQHYCNSAATPYPYCDMISSDSDDDDYPFNSGGGSLRSWRTSSGYLLRRRIGKGSYGEVVEAQDEKTKQLVAIKRVQDIVECVLDAKRIYREIHILRYISHPNVVKLLDVEAPHLQTLSRGNSYHLSPCKRGRSGDQSLNDLYLVFELVDTDLHKLLLSAQYLSTLHVQTFLYQILLGLLYLHSANVIHRDLKPANILVYENCTIKICDFGLSRIISTESGNISPATTATTELESPFSISASMPFPYQWGQLSNSRLEEEQREAQAGNDEPSGTLSMSMTPRNINDEPSPTLLSKASPGTVSFSINDADDDKGDQTTADSNSGGRAFFSSSDEVPGGVLRSSSAISLGDNDGIPLPPPIFRQMTHHVVTRWYRAPELILLCDYSKAVDIWSVGCILAELLGMQAESVPNFQQRAPLFPGSSCPSLSGDGIHDPFDTSNFDGHGTETETDRVDQLNIILDVIGTPDKEDIESVKNSTTANYLKKLPNRPAKNLSKIYKGASAEAIDLLERMLKFDPAKRITVEKALSHPYLAPVRDKSRETTCPVTLDADIENVSVKDEEEIFSNLKKEIMSFRA